MTSDLGIAVAFSAGILSILSPCVLALLPAYITYLTGVERDNLWLHSGLFILGFSTLFVLFGASATAVGRLLLINQMTLNKVAGVAVIVFGLKTLGILKLNLPQFVTRAPRTKYSSLNALLLGFAFGVGWTPCVGPILGSILMLASTQSQVYQGILLLISYSAGMAIPFLLFTAAYKKIPLTFLKKMAAYTPYVSGTILIVLGILLYFNMFSYLTRLG